MSFYDLPKEERIKRVEEINLKILLEIKAGHKKDIISFFSDEDTYIRKSAYLAIGKIFKAEIKLQNRILKLLEELVESEHEKVRQTAVNAAGEIGMKDF